MRESITLSVATARIMYVYFIYKDTTPHQFTPNKLTFLSYIYNRIFISQIILRKKNIIYRTIAPTACYIYKTKTFLL